MIAPEFSRRIRLDEIGVAPQNHRIEATPQERAALAARFALSRIDMLEAEIALSREALGIRARGHVRAAVNQICVVSTQDVPARIDEPIDVVYTRHQGGDAADEEVELSEAECDQLPLTEEAVDIGELAAETMSLALDPYPRLPDDQLAEYRAHLLTEQQAQALSEEEEATRNPFAALKDKFGK